MSPSEIEQRIFVVGAPRSGTTLVQSLLAAHSAVTSFTESHFFSEHYRLLPPLATPVLVRDPTPRLREFLAENGVDPGAAGPPARWPRVLLPLLTRAAARRFLRMLDELALGRGQSRWVEKTPRHLRYVPFLERLSGPGRRSRFVHVIRAGIDVVASLHVASQSWSHPYDIDACVRRWNADLRFSVGRRDAPTDCFVCYEELTAQPEAALRRLLTALELDWEPGLFERYGGEAGSLVTPQETWKQRVGGYVRPSSTARDALSEAQRERARGALRHDWYALLCEGAGEAQEGPGGAR